MHGQSYDHAVTNALSIIFHVTGGFFLFQLIMHSKLARGYYEY